MIDGIKINPIEKANRDIIDRLKHTKKLLEDGYQITYINFEDFKYRFGEYVGLVKTSRKDAFGQEDRIITEDERKDFIYAITGLIDKIQNGVIKLPIETILMWKIDYCNSKKMNPNLDLIGQIEEKIRKDDLGDNPDLHKMLKGIIEYIDQREK